MSSTPLDRKQMTYEDGFGKKELLPALHPKWLEKMKFVGYVAPVVDVSDRGKYEEWLERLRFIAEDLHWLLQLPHDKFWCQAVFNETLHTLLDTYLRFAPRSYDVIYDLPDEARDLHLEMHRLIFMTCVRLATHKESKDDHISPSVFGDILYENFIFDIPKLFDLCVLYSQGNSALLSKMVTNIFTQQPRYVDDLRATIPTVLQVLDSIREMCGISADSFGLYPQKLDSFQTREPLLMTMSMGEFQDILFYLADTGFTLSNFLEIYPPACAVFHEFEFAQRLASFYERVIPEVLSALKEREFDSASQKRVLKLKLHQAKKSLLKTFHNVVVHTCIQPVLEKSGRGDVDQHVEDFLHTMSAVLNERRFLADYEGYFNFQEDVDILCQSSCGIDETQFRYIQDAINSAFATFGKRKKPKGATRTGGRTSPDGSPGPLEEGAVGGAVGGAMGGAVGGAVGTDYTSSYNEGAYQVEYYDCQGAEAPRVTGIQLESMISSVQDLLPDLGEGFIELLLEEFNYDLEKVINAVLEDKLPPSLNDIDRNLERELPEEVPPTLLETRLNVYDNDEFDVFNRDDVDTSRIHQGKKDDKISLDDKSDVKLLKATYEAYGSLDVPSMYDKMSMYDYDDEYDDTYDSNNVGADDADSADELTARRPFTVPRVLQQGQTKREPESESESEDSDDTPPRDVFVQDPAKLRQAAEERRQSKAHRGGHVDNRAKRDVKGKAKGQGQDENVVRNRLNKDKHKASRANHNRRNLADKKRAKAMF